MKASSIETEIQKIDAEIRTLEAIRARLVAVSANGETATEPKARKTRKRKVGLPTATPPPPSEANLVGKDGRL